MSKKTNTSENVKLVEESAVWLPGPLYRALPFAYIIAGLLTILLIDSLFALLSGTLLVAAAMLWWWRRKSRRTGFASDTS
jgi:hypothetical protein